MSRAIIEQGYTGLEVPWIDGDRKPKGYAPVEPRLHVGSVEFVKYALQHLDVEFPDFAYDDLPYNFLNRDILYLPAHRLVGYNRFVKPAECKKFKNVITLRNERFICSHPAYSQELVEFRQEYRVYILRGDVIGIGRYDDYEAEDIPTSELESFAKLASSAYFRYEKEWAGYAVDVGIIRGRGLSVVEFSDGWALGWYKGCDPRKFHELLQARWDQLTRR